MSPAAPPNPDLSGVRRAIRETDVKTLGALVASQLTAYRCSTVYGPSEKVLREVIDTHALPRLEQLHEIRRVVIRDWPDNSPTIAGLIDALLHQLELAPAPDPEPPTLAAACKVVERAHRVSDRPLVIVLYDLERLLDDGRDRFADQKFIDALAALVDLPIRGLQLVLAVQEVDLGAFRHLLRGRQRLLANDLRLHGDDRRVVIPIGGLSTGIQAVSAAGKGGIVAAIAGGAMGVAGVILAIVGLGALDEAKQIRASVPPPAPAIECPTCEECPECPGPGTPANNKPDQPPEDPPEDPPDVAEPDPNADPTDPKIPPVNVFDPKLNPDAIKAAMCTPKKGDGACAQCTRSTCCKDLQACRSAKWRNCVLGGKVPSADCQPDLIEQHCRPLALCALEYKCNASCFGQEKP